MIKSDSLDAWLADRSAHLATLARMEEVRRRLFKSGPLQALSKGLAEAAIDGPGGVMELVRRFIAAKGSVAGLMDALVEAAAGDPFFRPLFKLAASEVHLGLTLIDQPALTLTLATFNADAIAAKRLAREGGASLVFTGRMSLFHFIKGGGATLSFWEIPPVDAGFTAMASGACRFLSRRRVEDGETIELDGRRQAFIIDEAAQDIVFLQATTLLDAAPLKVEYDSATLRFVGASSGDETSSRTQMMLSLLRALDRQDAAPLFQEMLKSEHFYARWQAMREFLALDAMAALPHLRFMAERDPHPEVRQACTQTLAAFFPDDRAPAEEMIECPA